MDTFDMSDLAIASQQPMLFGSYPQPSAIKRQQQQQQVSSYTQYTYSVVFAFPLPHPCLLSSTGLSKNVMLFSYLTPPAICTIMCFIWNIVVCFFFCRTTSPPTPRSEPMGPPGPSVVVVISPPQCFIALFPPPQIRIHMYIPKHGRSTPAHHFPLQDKALTRSLFFYQYRHTLPTSPSLSTTPSRTGVPPSSPTPQVTLHPPRDPALQYPPSLAGLLFPIPARGRTGHRPGTRLNNLPNPTSSSNLSFSTARICQPSLSSAPAWISQTTPSTTTPQIYQQALTTSCLDERASTTQDHCSNHHRST